MTTQPAKVNALRALEEAAERHGWSLDESSRSPGPVLVRPETMQKRRAYVYVVTHADGDYIYSSEPGPSPVELVELLLAVPR